MKYEVRTSKVENGINGVVALATIIIEDKFAVNNVRLVYKPNEDKYSVVYPGYKPKDNEMVKYINVLHPCTPDLSKALKEAMLTSYNTGENQVVTNHTEFNLSVRVKPCEKNDNDLVAFCDVKFSDEDEFGINEVTLRKNAEGEKFLCMPKYKKNDSDYGFACEPITSEFRDELHNAIMDTYCRVKNDPDAMLKQVEKEFKDIYKTLSRDENKNVHKAKKRKSKTR